MDVGASGHRDDTQWHPLVRQRVDDDDEPRLSQLVDPADGSDRVQWGALEGLRPPYPVLDSYDDSSTLSVGEAHGSLGKVLQGIPDRATDRLEVKGHAFKIRGPSAVPDRGKDSGDPSIHLPSPSFDPVPPVIPDQNFRKVPLAEAVATSRCVTSTWTKAVDPDVAQADPCPGGRPP